MPYGVWHGGEARPWEEGRSEEETMVTEKGPGTQRTPMGWDCGLWMDCGGG